MGSDDPLSTAPQILNLVALPRPRPIPPRQVLHTVPAVRLRHSNASTSMSVLEQSRARPHRRCRRVVRAGVTTVTNHHEMPRAYGTQERYLCEEWAR